MQFLEKSEMHFAQGIRNNKTIHFEKQFGMT